MPSPHLNFLSGNNAFLCISGSYLSANRGAGGPLNPPLLVRSILQSTVLQVCLRLCVQNNPQSAYEVLPNVREGLEALKSLGLRLGVVSNFDSSLTPTLRAHDLSGYFDFTVTSESAGAAKPEPAIFYRALGEFDVGPLSPGEVITMHVASCC